MILKVFQYSLKFIQLSFHLLISENINNSIQWLSLPIGELLEDLL